MTWLLESIPFSWNRAPPSVLEYFAQEFEHGIISLLGKARKGPFILHLQPRGRLPNCTDLPCEKMWPHINKLHL